MISFNLTTGRKISDPESTCRKISHVTKSSLLFYYIFSFVHIGKMLTYRGKQKQFFFICLDQMQRMKYRNNLVDFFFSPQFSNNWSFWELAKYSLFLSFFPV